MNQGGTAENINPSLTDVFIFVRDFFMYMYFMYMKTYKVDLRINSGKGG